MQQIFRFVFFGLLVLSLSACKSSSTLFGLGSVEVEGTQSSAVELPIELKNGLIFVEVLIEGKPYNFLFDSGAPMVISNDLAEKLELKGLKDAGIRDSQGASKELEYVRMPDFNLGNRSFKNLVAIAADLKASPILHCLNLDGIIGANAMQFQYWDFNLQDTVLRISSDKSHWPQTKKYVLPFKMKNSRTPLVQLTINDTKVQNITFDTGSSGIFSLPKRMTPSFKPDSASFSSRGYLSAGLFGSTLDTVYEYEMRFVFPDTSYRFPVEQEHTKEGKLLGMEFLRHFHVYLDYPKQEISLVPIHAKPQRGSFPLAPFLDEQVVIVGVLNSLLPEEYQHLEIGDEILSVNGQSIPQPATKDDFCTVIEAMQTDCVDLVIRDKGEVRICRKAIPGH